MIPSFLQYEFMMLAFMIGGISAIIAPLIGIFLTVQRSSFLSDTLAHVAFTGVALGIILGIHPVLSVVLICILAAIGIEYVRWHHYWNIESVLSIVLFSSIASASVLLSLSRGRSVNVSGILFGSITSVSTTDVMVVGILAMVITVILWFFWKELVCITCDEELAEASGIPVRPLRMIFSILVACTVAVSLRTVGLLLIGALMIIPVNTALILGASFVRTTLWSVLFSLMSMMIGLTASYYLGTSSGGTIVLTSLGLLCATRIVSSFFSHAHPSFPS